MAERKTRTTPSTVKKKASSVRRKATTERAPRRAGLDRSFAEVLQSKSVDTILPEVSNRLEAGRRLYAKEAAAAATAELAVLHKERERLAEEGEAAGPARARIERLVAAVEADIGGATGLLDEMEKAITPQRGGWSLMGRVVLRDGSVPKNAQIVFLDQSNEPIEELRALKIGADGIVRQAFPAKVVERLQAKGVKVTVAVQVRGRTIATDPAPVSLKPGALHQFDLRVNKGLE